MPNTLTTPDETTTADPAGPRWYYRVHGLDRGPITWDALQDLARDGTLKPSDLVRCGQDGGWVVASRARAEEPPERPRRADPPPTQVPPVDDELPVAPATEVPAEDPRPTRPSSPAGPAVLALALSLVGLFVLALPLGMVSVYLGARAAAAARRARSGGTALLATVALLVGLTDVGVALWAIGAKLAVMRS